MMMKNMMMKNMIKLINLLKEIYDKNCVLLTQQGEIKQLNTKIFKIVDL
jgi:hypothetical protein